MNISEELIKEHQLIMKVIGSMVKLSDCHENLVDTIFLELAHRFVLFVEEFADDYHHAKEEDILFYHLAQPGVLEHCNPIGQMLHEHDIARDSLNVVRQGVSTKDCQLIRSGIHKYSEVLTQHIFKENNILYPMAENQLSEQVKKVINQSYEAIELNRNKQKLWKRQLDFVEELDRLVVESLNQIPVN
ncbi:hemerythrin domain-containing protein [Aliikangiella coralliicola]|uniref:Hemerythrin-like domain-containing protein n=1 Tax=Aliikangiella coralliicola TaxID=2592383 RepID=A0A545UHQ0_9GAMM|nr:hemerythrin domain-containing protein [Aliikangiella coralliicola]TQV88997.1 hypothetical protein FLL46_05565 [Aliikangiella coralliicola]